MTTIPLQKWIDKNNGKYRDFDGQYGAQCVDLIRFYLQEVLGISGKFLPPVKYAKELYTKFTPNAQFTRIKNTPSFIPKNGDIIIWDFYPFVTGWAGHVAIFVEGDVNRFISFEQNYPAGSFCRYVNHNYRGVLGVLRYNG